MAASLVRAAARRVVLGGSDLLAAATGRRARFVLILGHMRSGGTLVNHLLISHPDLLGCGELNCTYHETAMLDQVRWRILRHHQALLHPPRYYVDQIHHSRMTPDPRLLDDPRLRLIFLLRQPGPTLGSLVKVLGPLYGKQYEDGPDYYRERVGTLAALAAGLAAPERALALSYESLLDDTAAQLARLTAFLELREPLTDSYREFDFTGRRGDPGPMIHSGRIVRDKVTHEIELTDEVRQRLQDAHDACWAALTAHCRG